MSADASPHLSATREIRAAPPCPDLDALRTAYLDLLKLSLCDLAGAGTTSVIWNSEDPVFSRELGGEDLKRRVVGQDWPLHGLTMIGLDRLDDLQRCVESVVRDGVEGDLIEAGTWRGGATILMRATLDALGEDGRTVWLADSFQGFPRQGEDQDPRLDPLSEIQFLSAHVDDVRANFARFGLESGVEFVPGFFEDTLSALGARRWALVRLDGDTYESTWQALEALYPGLARGGYLVIDDYGFIEACRRAVNDFRDQHGITEPLERIDWNGVRWRRESEPPPPPADGVGGRPASEPRPYGPRRPQTRIPSWEELELRRQLTALRERLDAAEAELGRLRRSPVAGIAEWVRRKLLRGARRSAPP